MTTERRMTPQEAKAQESLHEEIVRRIDEAPSFQHGCEFQSLKAALERHKCKEHGQEISAVLERLADLAGQAYGFTMQVKSRTEAGANAKIHVFFTR